VGRMGCHLSGDGCWGIPNSMPQPDWLSWLPGWTWACYYPHNVINLGILIPGCLGSHCMALAEPVFPTSLYESGLSLVSFGILWTLRKRIHAPVVLFGLFLILYATERLFIEQIRVNHKYPLLGLQVTQAEIISVLLILTGIITVAYFYFRHKKSANSL
jgi:phosphatidylglycerol---prolipoprotein diacylglyceryl transferase